MYDDEYDYEEYDERRGFPKWILPAGIAIGFMFLVFLMILSPPKPRALAPKPDEPSESEAWTMAKQFVSGKLKSPGTADWGWQSSRDVVKRTGPKTFHVEAWVDSQNGFGALIRTKFVCDLEYLGKDEWRCSELRFLQ